MNPGSNRVPHSQLLLQILLYEPHLILGKRISLFTTRFRPYQRRRSLVELFNNEHGELVRVLGDDAVLGQLDEAQPLELHRGELRQLLKVLRV